MPTYYVDISGVRASAGENSSGVTRVERELARRAAANLGKDARYVYYDLTADIFRDLGPVTNRLDDALLAKVGSSLVFAKDSALISFGLECNNKNYRRLIELARAKKFVLHSVLYDLTGSLNPQLTIEGYGEFLRGFFADMSWCVKQYLCISAHAADQLDRLAREEFLPPVKKVVFPLGAEISTTLDDPDDSWIAKTAIGDRRYILFVSTIEARKNHYTVYRAWDRLVASGQIDPEQDCLVFAGKIGWGVDDLVGQISTNPNTAESIVMLHDLSDEQIQALYLNCLFTVFPSFDEGFGLPVVEALSLGKYALCSTAGALPSVGGRFADYIDPLDIPAWQEKIRDLITSPQTLALKEAEIKEGFSWPKWDESAKIFYGLIKAKR